MFSPQKEKYSHLSVVTVGVRVIGYHTFPDRVMVILGGIFWALLILFKIINIRSEMIFFSSEMILMDQIFGEDFSCTIEDLAS